TTTSKDICGCSTYVRDVSLAGKSLANPLMTPANSARSRSGLAAELAGVISGLARDFPASETSRASDRDRVERDVLASGPCVRQRHESDPRAWRRTRERDGDSREPWRDPLPSDPPVAHGIDAARSDGRDHR